jgi:hypothetical protein
MNKLSVIEEEASSFGCRCFVGLWDGSSWKYLWKLAGILERDYERLNKLWDWRVGEVEKFFDFSCSLGETCLQVFDLKFRVLNSVEVAALIGCIFREVCWFWNWKSFGRWRLLTAVVLNSCGEVEVSLQSWMEVFWNSKIWRVPPSAKAMYRSTEKSC